MKSFERFIHHVRVERPSDAETATEARERLREKLPRNALRRMTHLGLLLGSALDGVTLGTEDAVVYATTFAETRALEDFLASFPMASPLGFQTSIHPSGIQQVLIARQQPVSRLWPHAGRERVVEQALVSALLETATRVIIAGGEERGTWLLEQGQASARSFAFALELRSEAKGAVGRVAFPGSAGVSPASAPVAGETPALPGKCPSLADFADALAARRPLAWSSAQGTWSLAWS